MKVVLFNGSPRKDGNTFNALRVISEKLNENSIETEIVHVGSETVKGCIACGGCSKSQNQQCSIKTDPVNDWIQLMNEADGIIISSPVYFSGVNGTMKSFLDRAFYVSSVNNSMFRHKVGAAVVAVRRSGGLTTFNELNHYLQYCEMFIATSNYWNVVHGTGPNEINEDKEGLQILNVLGNNFSFLLNTLNESKVEKPKAPEKVFTSFIR